MTDLDLTDVATVAAFLGLTPEDTCEPDGIDWGYTPGPAEGAPVFLLDGYYADDGNAEIHFPHADTARAAAQEYVDGGDWGDDSATQWITVYTWQQCLSVDPEGRVIRGRYGEDRHKLAIEPNEPECPSDAGHDWQSPHEIVGGIKENPGVWGHGGGVTIDECCMHCGCRRHTDTWAQDMTDGEQGLHSVSYEPGCYSDALESAEPESA